MELNELRKVAESATPGPWEIDNLDRVVRTRDRGIVHDDSCADSEEWLANTDAPFIATFDPPSVLALLSRLEQAEQDRDKLMNRLDAMRRQRDGYRNQLRKTEQQVQRVRELALKDTDALLRMNTRSDGLYLSHEILRALDGEPNA